MHWLEEWGKYEHDSFLVGHLLEGSRKKLMLVACEKERNRSWSGGGEEQEPGVLGKFEHSGYPQVYVVASRERPCWSGWNSEGGTKDHQCCEQTMGRAGQ